MSFVDYKSNAIPSRNVLFNDVISVRKTTVVLQMYRSVTVVGLFAIYFQHSSIGRPFS